jgi:hypothetical protein
VDVVEVAVIKEEAPEEVVDAVIKAIEKTIAVRAIVTTPEEAVVVENPYRISIMTQLHGKH